MRTFAAYPLDAVKPGMPVFEVSAKTGWGMEAWIEYLVERIEEKQAKDTPARAD
jgi:Ni2+-binding GTPase involved in maturation of urease and hydrogenase